MRGPRGHAQNGIGALVRYLKRGSLPQEDEQAPGDAVDGDNGIRAKKRLQVLLKALLEYSAVASLEPDLVIMHENDSLELFHLVVFHVDRLRIVRNLATGDLVEGHGQGLRIGGTGDFHGRLQLDGAIALARASCR